MKISILRTGKRELIDLGVALVLAFALSASNIALIFIDHIYTVSKTYAGSRGAEFAVNFIFLWTFALLWVAYRRWREASRRTAELENIVSSISPDVFLVIDGNRRIAMCSGSVGRMFGYRVQEVVGRKTDLLYSDRRTRAGNGHEIREVLERDGFHIGPATGRRKNGDPLPLEIITCLLRERSGAVLLLHDITERKRAEDALRTSEERFRVIFDSAQDAILIETPDGHILDANRAAVEMLGYAREELLDMRVSDIVPPEQAARFPDRIRSETLRKGVYIESENMRKDGTRVPVEVSCTLIEIGGLERVIALTRDITKRKKAEEALRLTQFAVDRAGEAVFWIGEDASFIYVNEAACRSLGYSRGELLSMTVHDVDPNYTKEVWPEHWEELKKHGILTFESRHRTKSGREFPVEITTNYFAFEGREFNFAFARDITGRKRSEDRIRASLREKEILLKEIHHRVKNNLQVVSSLLMLQSNYAADPRILGMLQASQNRIRSMALVHELLYKSGDLAGIEMGDYIRNLASQLVRSYRTEPGSIDLVIHADNVCLNIDKAIPFGLIISELVSNSLKHAFPKGGKGQIRIELHPGREGTFTLAVGDDGVGVPEGMDFRRTDSLGFHLVLILVKQLDGTIRMVRDGGVRFEMVFPLQIDRKET